MNVHDFCFHSIEISIKKIAKIDRTFTNFPKENGKNWERKLYSHGEGF